MSHIRTHLLKNQLLSTCYALRHSPNDEETPTNKIDILPTHVLPRHTESNQVNKYILKT